MTSLVTTEKLFAEIIAEAKNPRQKESLERMRRACDYLAENDVEITPRRMMIYCQDRGWSGPKEQSIRNSGVLTRYFKARKNAQALIPRGKRELTEPQITNESVRAYVQLLKDELEQANSARQRILAGLRTIPGVPVDDLIRVGFGGTPAPPSTRNQSSAPMSPALREALARLLDAGALADCGLQLHKERLRQSITGNVLLEKHHVLALRELGQGSSGEQEKLS